MTAIGPGLKDLAFFSPSWGGRTAMALYSKASNLDAILDAFLHNTTSLGETVPMMMFVLLHLHKEKEKEKEAFLEANGSLEEEHGTHKTYKLQAKDVPRERELSKAVDQLTTSTDQIPKIFLVSFVSEYDAFLGALVRAFYTKKPELLTGLERQLSFSELLKFASLDEAKDFILEKEVESILRKSHSEQFEILERKFSLKLRKDLAIWPVFIELTERRNLFVHTDGVVSSQYLSVCKDHGCAIEKDASLGQHLFVSPSYLKTANACLREIATKLTHVLWRKIFPDEREQADRALLRLSYDAISSKHYEFAINILEFATALPKHFDDNTRRMFFVNLAQAYKYSGEEKKCDDILGRLDWSSVTYKFKLAVAVLNDDYAAAEVHMKRAAATDEIGEVEFLDWPLFKDFRKSVEFKRAFEASYGRRPPEDGAITVETKVVSDPAAGANSCENADGVPSAAKKPRSRPKKEAILSSNGMPDLLRNRGQDALQNPAAVPTRRRRKASLA